MPRLVETTIPCCVCGWHAATRWRTAGDHLLGGPREFRAVRCVRCQTVRLDPRPSDEEMQAHYTESTYARAEGDEDAELAERLDAYNARLIARVLGKVNGGAPQNVLDVGCGDGRFLVGMQESGWEATGLETDPVVAKIAGERTQTQILPTFLENSGLPESHFGVISLHHVLEHVPDPRVTLEHAYKLLAPGGMLFLALPNVGSVEAKLFRSTWCPLDLPRHFWGFHPHSLTRLVEEIGFVNSYIAHFPLFSTPQSLRYAARAMMGQSPSGNSTQVATQATPITEEKKEKKEKNERGGLRTKGFLALLNFSERVGQHLPGEVMELVAYK
jgi:2-polyprenyl-3-methyl-5-hydroxy-6-metoxy-1,4-benzoquinol methylase